LATLADSNGDDNSNNQRLASADGSIAPRLQIPL
jgi:hypothetical protein